MEVSATPIADAPPPRAGAEEPIARAASIVSAPQTDAAPPSAGPLKPACGSPPDRLSSARDLSPLSSPPTLSAPLPPLAPSAAGAPAPILIHLTGVSPAGTGGVAYIWDAADALRLRQDFRLLGDPVGTLARHSAQSQFLALPLALSYTEAYFGVMRGFLVAARDAPEDYPAPAPGDTERFYRERERRADEHVEEVLAHQERMRKNKLKKEAAEKRKKVEAETKAEAEAGGKEEDGPGKTQGRKRAREAPAEAPPAKARRTSIAGRVWAIATGALAALAARLPAWAGGRAPPALPAPPANGVPPNGAALPASAGLHPPTERASMPAPTPFPAAGATAAAPSSLAARRRQQARASSLIETPACAPAGERGPPVASSLIPPAGVGPASLKRKLFVFEDLYDRGYCMSCGAKFGADFLAYAGDPLLFHAPLAVIVLEGEAQVAARDVVAQGRLGDSTKKRTLLAFVEGEGADRKVSYLGAQWEETLP